MRIVLIALLTLTSFTAHAATESTAVVTMHGHAQRLHLYGDRTDPPIVLSSGDGGWIHLAPEMATFLAAHHYYVIGFDAKAYLSSATSGDKSLSVSDVPTDFLTLIALAGPTAPVLAGVSEGGGLSVLAAADDRVKARIAGVLTVGLGEANELAWRWRDDIIYLTKGVPDEPTFNAADYIGKIAPVPIAMLRATHDEFVTTAQSDHLAAVAKPPVRVWTIPAGDHRFSGDRDALDAATAEALRWIAANRVGSVRTLDSEAPSGQRPRSPAP